MSRFFLHLAYDGSGYHGWQSQENAHTVQAAVEAVLSKRFGTGIAVTGAGRTDTGVHATSYFAHFDTPASWQGGDDLFQELHAMMPRDISLLGLFPVKDDAHARFDALSRTYHYVIDTGKDPFLNRFCWHYWRAPDILSMNEAAALLVGQKDFSSFERTGSDNTNSICTVMSASWAAHGTLLVFRIEANRFLRNMVRAIVGTLTDTGVGKLETQEFRQIMEAGDRSRAGISAPAQGLFLSRVNYPADIFTGSIPGQGLNLPLRGF